MSWLEPLAVATGIVSVYLSVRQNIWSWPTALVNVTLYFFVFRAANLYADMGLQVFYFILSVYGLYEWLYGGEKRTELKVSRITPRVAGTLLAITVAGVAGLDAVLRRTPDTVPFLDSVTSTASIVGQWMMTRKILENWTVWIAVNVLSIGMYVYKGLNQTAGLYAGFLVLAIMGYVKWHRSYTADRASVGQPVGAVPAA
ncbi:MAG: nicotinamide riboside transporter PnuC [Gemmatimonadaceae bacterium]